MEHTNVTKLSTLFYSLLLGLLLGAGIVERNINDDPVIVNAVYHTLQTVFHKQFGGILRGRPERINIFFPEISLRSVKVYDAINAEWHWSADRLSFSFSWLLFLLRKKIDLIVSVDGLNAVSSIDDTFPAIATHIQSFIFGKSAVPISLKALSLHKGRLLLQKKGVYEAAFSFDAQLGIYTNRYRMKFVLDNGKLLVGHKECFSSLQGIFGFDIDMRKDAAIEASLDGSLILPHLPVAQQKGTVSANWHMRQGQCIVHNADKSVACALYNIASQGVGVSADYHLIAPASYLQQFMLSEKLQQCNQGTLTARGSLSSLNGGMVNGNLSSSNLQFYEQEMPDLFLEYDAVDSFYTYSLEGMLDGKKALQSSGYYSARKREGESITVIDRPVVCSGLSIPAYGLFIRCGLAGDALSVLYQMQADHKGFALPIQLQGSLRSRNGSIETHGICNDYLYQLKKEEGVIKAEVDHDVGDHKATVMIDETNAIEAKASFALLQKMFRGVADKRFSGHGMFTFLGACTEGVIAGTLGMQNSSIRLLHSHNIITSFLSKIRCDIRAKNLLLSDARIVCDKGEISSKKIVCSLDPSQGISFLYCPLSLERLFFNSGKDFFTVLTGSLVLKKKSGKPLALTGNCIIDRSRLNKNIFSEVAQQSKQPLVVLPQQPQEDCVLDIGLETRAPLHVETHSLSALVHTHLKLEGTIAKPEITGDFTTQEGKLLFPYRPLNITKGAIYFLPNQMNAPLLKLEARAKIRNYYLTMHCSGSLHQPHVSFESTPPLTEEQILTLLFAGSEEGSFSMIMPAIVMQRLQHILFGGGEESSALGGYLKKILGPLRFIRLVPQFADQTARGGIRGAIEIDVTDHLRAIIQKNFSITEDTKIDVEYYLSDEITIRATKDERSDIGAEIEMRWKF